MTHKVRFIVTELVLMQIRRHATSALSRQHLTKLERRLISPPFLLRGVMKLPHGFGQLHQSMLS
jgi:hypothetical protein